jgi:hypothetical protein
LLTYVKEDQVTVSYHEDDNAISFYISDVMCKFHSNLIEVKDGFIHTTGELEADVYKFDVIVGITITTINATNATTGETYLLPSILPYSVKIMIDRKHVDITVTGSILSSFADVLSKILIEPLCSAIET